MTFYLFCKALYGIFFYYIASLYIVEILYEKLPNANFTISHNNIKTAVGFNHPFISSYIESKYMKSNINKFIRFFIYELKNIISLFLCF